MSRSGSAMSAVISAPRPQPLSLEGLADDAVGQGGPVSLPREHAHELADPCHRGLAPGGPDLAGDEPPRRGGLLVVVDQFDRIVDVLVGHAPPVQLGGQRAAGQAAAVVPRLHPGPGEGRIVDQARLGEPVEDRLGGRPGDVLPPQRLRELGPAPRLDGEQPQADLPGGGLRVLGALGALRCPGPGDAPRPPRGSRGVFGLKDAFGAPGRPGLRCALDVRGTAGPPGASQPLGRFGSPAATGPPWCLGPPGRPGPLRAIWASEAHGASGRPVRLGSPGLPAPAGGAGSSRNGVIAA